MPKTKTNSKEAEAYLAKHNTPNQEILKSPTQKLIINISTVDANGKRIAEHIGKFNILGTDLYSETIEFRPLVTMNKLIKMLKSKGKDGKEQWRYVNETVFFNNYSDPMPDTKGGNACGKVFGDARKMLSGEAAKANNDKAKSYFYAFGMARFPGQDWMLVDFRIGGKRIITASEMFSKKTVGKRNAISQFVYTMSLVPDQDGSIHPGLSIEVDLDNVLPVDDILEADAKVAEFITASNARILATHKKYSAQQQSVEDDEDVNIEIGEDE